MRHCRFTGVHFNEMNKYISNLCMCRNVTVETVLDIFDETGVIVTVNRLMPNVSPWPDNLAPLLVKSLVQSGCYPSSCWTPVMPVIVV